MWFQEDLFLQHVFFTRIYDILLIIFSSTETKSAVCLHSTWRYQTRNSDHTLEPQLCLQLQGGGFWLWSLCGGFMGLLAVVADDCYVPEI